MKKTLASSRTTPAGAAILLIVGVLCLSSGNAIPPNQSLSLIEESRQKLKSSDPQVRRDAVDTLRQLGASDPAPIDVLLGLLTDPVVAVRVHAASALSTLGREADALPVLIDCLNNAGPANDAEAAAALERMARGSNAQVVSALLAAVPKAAAGRLIRLVEVLRRIVPEAMLELAPELLPVLRAAASDPVSWNRVRIAELLVELGDDKEALPVLVGCIGDTGRANDERAALS